MDFTNFLPYTWLEKNQDKSSVFTYTNVLFKTLQLFSQTLSGNLVSYNTFSTTGKNIVYDGTTLFCTTTSSDVSSISPVVSSSTISSSNCAIADLSLTTGKWYWEYKIGNSNVDIGIGIVNNRFNTGNIINDSNNYVNVNESLSYWFYYSSGIITNGLVVNPDGSLSENIILQSTVGFDLRYGAGDTIGISIDMDNGALWFSKNGNFFLEDSTSTMNGSCVLKPSTAPLRNLYGHQVYPVVIINDVGVSVDVAFNPATHVYSTLFNHGFYREIIDIEDDLLQLQNFWDSYQTNDISEFKAIKDGSMIVTNMESLTESLGQYISSSVEKAYLINLPNILKAKGTLTAFKNLFNFFNISIDIIPWYDPQYVSTVTNNSLGIDSNIRNGIIVKVGSKNNIFIGQNTYNLILTILELLLDVCATIAYIEVYKDLGGEDLVLKESLLYEINNNLCDVYDWGLNRLPNLYSIYKSPHMGYFTGKLKCLPSQPPDYSGLFGTQCPPDPNCPDSICYKPSNLLDVYVQDPYIVVGNYNRILLEYEDGAIRLPIYSDYASITVGEGRKVRDFYTLKVGDPPIYNGIIYGDFKQYVSPIFSEIINTFDDSNYIAIPSSSVVDNSGKPSIVFKLGNGGNEIGNVLLPVPPISSDTDLYNSVYSTTITNYSTQYNQYSIQTITLYISLDINTGNIPEQSTFTDTISILKSNGITESFPPVAVSFTDSNVVKTEEGLTHLQFFTEAGIFIKLGTTMKMISRKTFPALMKFDSSVLSFEWTFALS